MNMQALGNDEHASRQAWMEMAFSPPAQIVQENKTVRLTNNGPLEESTSSGPEPRKRGSQAEQNHHSIDTLKKRGDDRRSGEYSPPAQTQIVR